MKENNDIDKLLRASLDSYAPAPDATGKKKFLEEAAGILPGGRRPGAWWKPLTIAVIIVALTGSLVWVYNSKSPTEILNNANLAINDQIGTSIKDTETQKSEELKSLAQSETENTQEKSTAISEIAIETSMSEGKSISYINAPPAAILQTESQPVKATEIVPEPSAVQSATTQYPITNIPVTDSTQHPIPNTQYPTANTPLQDSILKTDISQADTIIVPSEPLQPPKKGGRSMYSAFYRPELVFSNGEGNKMANSFGFEFQFRPFHPKYVIRAGLGISLSPGEYNYGIDYYEYMGSYLHLDSVTFALAEDNFHLLPTYYQTEREVYDSEVQTQYASTDKRFAYLYIPVMLGYDFIRKDNFTFGLRAGPSLSVLLNKKASEPQYNLGENQLVGVKRITPEREVMNWQVSGGLNMTFIMKNNYFIEAEPLFNYYFNQVSGEDGSKKNPYSIGFRIAVGIVPERKR